MTDKIALSLGDVMINAIPNLTNHELEALMATAQAELDKRCRVANGKAGG